VAYCAWLHGWVLLFWFQRRGYFLALVVNGVPAPGPTFSARHEQVLRHLDGCGASVA
jgi:hypothetical protein